VPSVGAEDAVCRRTRRSPLDSVSMETQASFFEQHHGELGLLAHAVVQRDKGDIASAAAAFVVQALTGQTAGGAEKIMATVVSHWLIDHFDELHAAAQAYQVEHNPEALRRFASVLWPLVGEGLWVDASAEDLSSVADAEPLLRRALETAEASYGSEDPRVATVLSNLAQLLKSIYKLEEAERMLRRALAIHEASHGAEHEVARDLNNLAQLLKAKGRLAEAEPLVRRAIEIAERCHGNNHPNVAVGLSNLAQLLHLSKRTREAEPLLLRALSIHEASYGPDHVSVASDLNSLAKLLNTGGRVREAERMLRRAHAILLKTCGDKDPRTQSVQRGLAQLRRRR
jgi:tetratricopeptide (TPR) repeat protein